MADGRFTVFRRAKLPLATLPPDALARAAATGAALEARLSLTAPDGTPLCATVPALRWSATDPPAQPR